jgi:hypothetical protein
VRTYCLFLVLALAAVLCSHATLPVRAAHQPQASPAKTADSFSPHDLSGVWFISEYHQNILPNEDPPFQPWAAALYKKRNYEKEHSEPDRGPDPVPRCIPPGIPRTMIQPLPWEIVMAPDRVVMIFEFQSLVRQIFTDGRGHSKDLDPTYMGNSIGHWDGDTLVVDTIGFNGKTWIDPKGLPTTGALHVTELIRRVSHDTLSDDYTIDDRKAYTKPWTVQKLFTLHPDWQIKEYVCAENNLTH